MTDNCKEDRNGRIIPIPVGRLMKCARTLATHFDLCKIIENANELLRDEITTNLKSTFKGSSGKAFNIEQDIIEK